MTTFARSTPRFVQRNPAARLALAERWLELETGTLIAYRIPYMQAQGKIPNHEASMSKLYGSELSQRIARTGMQLLGLHGMLGPESPHAPLAGRLQTLYQTTASATIAAGTSEIQRGIIATRGLGMPRG